MSFLKITSKGDKSAPRLNVISMRNLFGSSKATCIEFVMAKNYTNNDA